MKDIISILCEKLKFINELSVLSGVFTHVPKDISYPYISLEKLSVQESFGAEIVHLKLKVWSRYSGNAEISTFESVLKNTLEKQGWIPGSCLKIESSKMSVLNDGMTRILDMDLKILIREI